MYFTVEAHQFAQYGHLLDQMFRLRHRVFCEKLKWVDLPGPAERDQYDDMNPVYLLHTDEKAEKLYAAARFMPTTGPTLLSDVFGDTMPDACAFQSSFVWEITRLCIDEERLQADQPGRSSLDVVRRMLLAGMEFGVRSGIESFLSNFDDVRLRIWRRCGAQVDIVGTADGFSVPVILGLTECSADALEGLRARAGHAMPVLTRAPRPNRREVPPIHAARSLPHGADTDVRAAA